LITATDHVWEMAMSLRAIARRAVPVLAAALLGVAPLSFDVSANEAADKMADTFAGASDRSEAAQREADRQAEDARKREAELKADEARKEAAARKAAELLKATQAKRRAEAQRRNPTPRARQSQTEEEADMLARARREADEMKALEEARILAEQAAAVERAQAQLRASKEALRQRAKAETQAPLDGSQAQAAAKEGAQKAAKETGKETGKETAKEAAQDADQQATAGRDEAGLALARAEETRRLAERLKRVRQIHEARLAQQAQRVAAERAAQERAQEEHAEAMALPATGAAPPAPRATAEADAPANHLAPSASEPGPPSLVPSPVPAPAAGPTHTDAKRWAETDRADEAGASAATMHRGRVTVLLVLTPGTYGIRRHGPKVADPVLCTLEGCYVSAGADARATFMWGRRALGFANTLGARAGACRQSLGCVFRGVEISAIPAYMQPVDLHILKHDRRRGQVVASDSACLVVAGRLSCNRGIYADDYVMWVVPEDIAAAAGAAALQRAVAEGLSAPRAASLAR
jgi:hypothetical protein